MVEADGGEVGVGCVVVQESLDGSSVVAVSCTVDGSVAALGGIRKHKNKNLQLELLLTTTSKQSKRSHYGGVGFYVALLSFASSYTLSMQI